MILVYHNVSPKVRTKYCVTVETFRRQMEYLKSYEVVPLSDYAPDNIRHLVLTFDDAYSDFVTFGAPILNKFGYPFEVFIVGDYIGKTNLYDSDCAPEMGCADIDQLKKIVTLGARLQWHSRTHARLSGLSKDRLSLELQIPDILKSLFPPPNFRWLAYPYGNHTGEVVDTARSLFDGAVSVFSGNNTDIYQLERIEVTESSKFFLTSYEKDIEMAKMENLLKVRDNEVSRLDIIVGSLSWRLTSPLRKISWMLRGIKRRCSG